MEAFPPEYFEHQLPLVLLSGLGEYQSEDGSPVSTPKLESGTRIVTSSAECKDDRAAQLRDQLLRLDGHEEAWNSTALPGPNGQLKYSMKAIGRTYTLPPRKAAPLPQSPSVEAFANPQGQQHKSHELHSPLSPLSPSSPIYPDGLFTPLWLAKHQQQVPAVFLAFFKVSASDDTSQNEQIQIDINAIKTALGRSGFKTRFAAILMSDTSILHAPELEEHLTAIRRATTLDPKHGLFFMPPMTSQAEIATFVHSIFATLQPLVIDYYRDLTKHARRKKVRGGPAGSNGSPAEGGARTLITPGWNVRYEVKQGVFAEFRQEMDVAERHYSVAIDELFGDEGIFEVTPSWSPRWDEARLLCDCLALRVLRCQLWARLTTATVVSWINYKERMKDLLDRRGKGWQTYSWDAWEARWAEIMAQLIQRAALLELQKPESQALDVSTELNALRLYAQPEKSATAAESIPPFHLMHHPGYWLRAAFDCEIARYEKALAIPEEDRIPPDRSPASAVAHRHKHYDTYLVNQPHEEYPSPGPQLYKHLVRLTTLAEAATREFSVRRQWRLAEWLNYELGQIVASAGEHERALDILRPLWDNSTWRDDDWNKLSGKLLALVHRCAVQVGNTDIIIQTFWEMLRYHDMEGQTPNSDMADYVSGNNTASEKVIVKMEDRQRLSPVSVAFAFCDKETYVGESLECQVILSSLAASHTAPINISRVEIVLSNDKRVVIKHKRDEKASSGNEIIQDLSSFTEDTQGNINAEANLKLPSNDKQIHSINVTFREAALVRLRDISIFMENDAFALEHKFTDEVAVQSPFVYFETDGSLQRRSLQHPAPTAVTVLPKPPKMMLLAHGLHNEYYTDERIHLEVEFVNEEADAVKSRASVIVTPQQEDAAQAQWEQAEEGVTELVIEKLDSSKSSKAGLSIVAPSRAAIFSVNIEVEYILESEPDSPLTKTLTLELNVLVPLVPKYNFGPSLHTGPWPSYFDVCADDAAGKPEGISQRWQLGCVCTSAAKDELMISHMKLVVDNVGGDAVCQIEDRAEESKQMLAAGHSMTNNFELVTQKDSLDDRRPVILDLSLHVTWARKSGGEEVVTSLPVPRLTLPSSEPRVLCTVADATRESADLVLQYHLENLSAHFLTFALTMEASDDFAFSGPKHRALSLAPLSHLRVEYHLFLHEEAEGKSVSEGSEARYIWPQLQVVDSYYQKQLRIHPAGPRVIMDEKRGLGVEVEASRD